MKRIAACVPFSLVPSNLIIHVVRQDEEKETKKGKRLKKESSTVKPKPTITTAETHLSAGPSVTLCTTALEIQPKQFAVPALA